MLNASLIAGWLLITVGGLVFNVAIGLLTSGSVLLGCTFYLAAKFGVYSEHEKPKIDTAAEA